MGRILFWGIGIFILVFLAFIPLAFQVQFQVSQNLSFSLSGSSGKKCYVGMRIGWGTLPPVPQFLSEP